MSQAKLAEALGCHQTTVGEDIRVLKQQSQQFVYGLAKGDLDYQYRRSIQGVEEAMSEAWKIYGQYDSNDFFNSTKLKLMALKIVIQANEAKFKLLSEGPSVLAMRSLEDRLKSLEESERNKIRDAEKSIINKAKSDEVL